MEKFFLFEFNHNGKNAYVVGSWDNWQKKHKLLGNSIAISLWPARYEYKYIVDDNWMCDSNKPSCYDPSGKHMNNYITIDDFYRISQWSGLQEDMKCKVCTYNKSCMVFIPCCHLVTCYRCASYYMSDDRMRQIYNKRCAVCKTDIKAITKISWC